MKGEVAMKKEWEDDFGIISLQVDGREREENAETVALLNMTLNKFGITVDFDEKVNRVRFVKTKDYRKKVTRGAGKHRKQHTYGIIELKEVEQKIEMIGADNVAKEMGISRSTLFRRIKEAKNNEDDYIY